MAGLLTLGGLKVGDGLSLSETPVVGSLVLVLLVSGVDCISSLSFLAGFSECGEEGLSVACVTVEGEEGLLGVDP